MKELAEVVTKYLSCEVEVLTAFVIGVDPTLSKHFKKYGNALKSP